MTAETIGTIEKLHENDANQTFKIQYSNALSLEGGDRQVAYPVEFDMQRIAESIQADLIKTGVIKTEETRRDNKADFYRQITVTDGEIKAEHVQLTYESTDSSTDGGDTSQ